MSEFWLSCEAMQMHGHHLLNSRFGMSPNHSLLLQNWAISDFRREHGFLENTVILSEYSYLRSLIVDNGQVLTLETLEIKYSYTLDLRILPHHRPPAPIHIPPPSLLHISIMFQSRYFYNKFLFEKLFTTLEES